jgi:hypothetical protein
MDCRPRRSGRFRGGAFLQPGIVRVAPASLVAYGRILELASQPANIPACATVVHCPIRLIFLLVTDKGSDLLLNNCIFASHSLTI